MPAPLSPNSGGTTSHSTKPASGQVAGYLPPAGERDADSLREFHVNRAAILPHLKSGDWLTLLLGGASVVLLALNLWNGGLADKAIIRSGGKIFREVPLSRDQQIEVPGPLGISVITIQGRKARIASDPSPRQYCVRQ
ncbi:MAG: NusG domain II-containing protein, partial [Gallionella sp.]|nr:NusG domain II-containing protein [Gallionella sp.]